MTAKTKNIEIKCNFDIVFANYNSVQELRDVANLIVGQVKVAFDERMKAITEKKDNNNIQVQVVPLPKEEKAEVAEKKPKSTKDAATKKAKAETKQKEDDTISLSDKKAIKKLGLKLEKYSEKSWVLLGDTKPLRYAIKSQFNGIFNRNLECGEGWLIRTVMVEECAKALGIKVNLK